MGKHNTSGCLRETVFPPSTWVDRGVNARGSPSNAGIALVRILLEKNLTKRLFQSHILYAFRITIQYLDLKALYLAVSIFLL
jgi:hypothetical protein